MKPGTEHPNVPGTIRFLPDGVDVPLVPGESLLSHALRGGVPLLSPCGGENRCGKCRVVVAGGTRGGDDPGTLTRAEIASGIRLACRCFPSPGDVSVTILPGSRPARVVFAEETTGGFELLRGRLLSGVDGIVRRLLEASPVAGEITDVVAAGN